MHINSFVYFVIFLPTLSGEEISPVNILTKVLLPTPVFPIIKKFKV
jgi:hypothetical protein